MVRPTGTLPVNNFSEYINYLGSQHAHLDIFFVRIIIIIIIIITGK